MSKLLVVFGITGQQGGSVAHHVLNSSTLSKQYRIRGVTRDTTSPKAQALQEKGVELFKADWSDSNSLARVMQGANAVFLVTMPAGKDANGQLLETVHGKAVVDAAISAAVEHFIFSTLPNIIKLSHGKYTGVQNFNGKADLEDYIRGKPIRSAFVAPGRFMQNYVGKMAPKQQTADGSYMIQDMFSPHEQVPLIDIAGDMGKFVGAILGNFDAFEGKTLTVAEKLYSMEEIAAVLSKTSGNQVEYVQLSEEAMRSQLPPQAADIFIQAQSFQREFGFYGPDTVEKIAWTMEMTKLDLTSFEDFL